MNKSKILTAYLAGREPAPFDWADANCGHFAGDYVQLVEGRNPLDSITMPTSLAACRRLQRKAGGLAAVLTQALAREPIAPAFAQLGDVVLLPLDPTDPEALACGICCGEQAACVTEDGAVMLIAMSAATYAWRVGA